MNLNNFKPIYTLIIALLLTNPLWANNDNDPDKGKISLFNQLVQEKYIEVNLKLDVNLIKQNINPIKKEHAAQITFKNQYGATMQMDLKVKTRGKYRQQFCDFPPLRLDFSKKRLRQKGFIGKFDKYKLVTHCMDDKDSDQTLFREYAVYKMYNELTPQSFRVHLLKITYEDINDASYQKEQYAFLIEENDELAERIGGKVIEQYGTIPSNISKQSFYNTMVFNYMIGNLDWNVKRQKNIKFISLGTDKPLISIPYDFDLCGIVRPEYAVLNPNFNQKSLDERFCIGKFENEAAMLQTVKRFKEIKHNFISSYADMSILKKRYKRDMTNYLSSFYGFLGDEEEMEAAFLAGKYAH